MGQFTEDIIQVVRTIIQICAERREIKFIQPTLLAALDKNERCNNDVKFSKCD